MTFLLARCLLRRRFFYNSQLPIGLQEVLVQLSNLKIDPKQREVLQIQMLYNELKKTDKEATEVNRVLAQQTVPEMQAIFQQELQDYVEKLKEQENLLLHHLVGKLQQSNGENEAIVEIRAGTGGIEATLFAHEMVELYKKYCSLKRWSITEIDCNRDCSKSLREGIFLVTGNGCLEAFECESGVHRVQRVPESENSGRLHTSTITIAVLPKTNSNFCIQPSDIRTELYRASSGPGGQHLNTTASAVRLLHIPTGIMASSIKERCQHANREHALKLLHFKVTKSMAEKQRDDLSASRKEQVNYCF